jgi:signal transduction histidine kinase
MVAEQHDALIERFVQKARRAPEAETLERIELVDSMGFFLDDLVEALAADVGQVREQSAAASHGIERLAIGFRIDRVIREFAMIGEVIIETAQEAKVEPTALELEVLIRTIGEGSAISAREYVRRREADILAREAAHVGVLAHEMRNSLASARFAFDLLRRRVPGDAESLVNIVDLSMRQATQRLDDTLAGARLRSGAVSSVRVFVGVMAEEIASEVRPQADAKHIRVDVEADQALALQADPRLVRSALTNLVQNAVKFSRPETTVRVVAKQNGGEIVVTVADACGGIAADKIDRIFAPFVQGGSDGSGFGLGLAIARDAAEAQGGTLTVENVANTGCIFTLTLRGSG